MQTLVQFFTELLNRLYLSKGNFPKQSSPILKSPLDYWKNTSPAVAFYSEVWL